IFLFQAQDGIRDFHGTGVQTCALPIYRAGILHRDIKPANVLETAYNWPKLADFGIAAQIEGTALEAEGMSIPWSAPELFATIPRSEERRVGKELRRCGESCR